jgi:general nucleoside transport system permease protein
MDIFNLFDLDILAATIRVSIPIMLAALGGLLCLRAGVFNIALEGQMLVGAFAGIVFTEWTASLGQTLGFSSAWFGILGGMLGGVAISMVFAVSILRFKADHIVAGIAINLLALGVTGFALKTIFDAQGVFRPTDMVPLPKIAIPLLQDVPLLGQTVSNHTPLVYLTFVLVLVTWVALYRMPSGLRLRSVGEQPDAARTAGIKVDRVRYQAIAWSGVLCGLAGAHLSLGYASEFTENMTQGRGFTAFVAAIFGQLDPILTMLASLLFGFAEALGLRIQLEGFGISPSLVQTFPYILAVVVLTISSAMAMRRRGRRNGLEA